ncbi:MAG TPA: PA2169 family four-helix-bundle protein [Usitatibacteraceae bacterium]|nr:PA2169 family four-helix-bundle protein [Usitatibacteraceae bacterium]
MNDLVETSRDGAAGFQTCAEGAKDAMLKAYFVTRAQDCNDAIRELNVEVLHHGGEPAEHGSTGGLLRRAWINIKSAVASNDDLAVLEECERAEDAAVAAYRKALQEDLPAHVKALVEKQYEGATANHDRVRKLRDERRQMAATTN